MMGWVFAAVAAYMLSKSGGAKRKVTKGTAQLKAGKTYRFEIAVDGTQVRATPTQAAQGLDNGLRMAGAYDVMVQPTLPLLASYSMFIAGDLPVVLDVPVSQNIGGLAGEYTFLSVQEIEGRKAAA